MLMSPLRPLANIQAVMPLMTIPIAATAITVPPSTGCGWVNRRVASTAIAPMATSRNTALNSAASTEDLRRP